MSIPYTDREHAPGKSNAVAKDGVELAPPTQALISLHRALRRSSDDSETLAFAQSPSLEHGATAACRHPLAEAMFTFTRNPFGLIRAFGHQLTSTRTRPHFLLVDQDVI